MNKTRSLQYSVIILLILVLIFMPRSGEAANTEYTSYLLGSIQWQTIGDFANAQQAGLQVLAADANPTGGVYFVRSIKNGCRWRYSWMFSKDVTQISQSRGETAITFRIESDGGACYNDYNPFLEFHADGDPTGQVVGPNREFAGRFCLKKDPTCNQNPTRKFQVYRQKSGQQKTFFYFNIIGPQVSGYGVLGLKVTYPYTGQTAGALSNGGGPALMSGPTPSVPTPYAQPPGSGAYRVEVRNGGTTYASVWRIQVSGNQITGTSEWDCCPGNRIDPIRGYIEGGRVVIQRDCSGPGSCQQIYSGVIGNGFIKGSFSGSGAAPNNDWVLYLETSPQDRPPSRGAGSARVMGDGVCADERTLSIMDEWLARAIPLQNQQPGWSVRYDFWGRLVGRSPTAIMNTSGSPDTSMTRCEWLWRYAADFGSTNLGTLREYVQRRRQQ